MGYCYVLANPAKKEFIKPDTLGGGVMLYGRHTVLVLTRLIADPPLRCGDIDGRWVGDPVVLAGGLGADPPNLYDRAVGGEFTDISYLALAVLCDDPDIRYELLTLAALACKRIRDDSDAMPKSFFIAHEWFFVDLCNALLQHRPEMMRGKEVFELLGKDWRKQYDALYRKSPWKSEHFTEPDP